MEFKAEYKWRHNRGKGENVIITVTILEELSSEIVYKSYRKWISTSRLKPYLDFDVEGKGWLFLGYRISEWKYHKLKAMFIIYDLNDDYITVVCGFLEVKKIIIKELLKRGKNVTNE